MFWKKILNFGILFWKSSAGLLGMGGGGGGGMFWEGKLVPLTCMRVRLRQYESQQSLFSATWQSQLASTLLTVNSWTDLSTESHAQVLLLLTHTKCLQSPMPRSVITDTRIQNVCRIPCPSPVITDTRIQNVCRIPCPGPLSQTHTKCLQNPMPQSCYHRHTYKMSAKFPCLSPVITDTYKMSAVLLSQTHTKCLPNSHASVLLSQTHTKCLQSCYHRHIQNVCSPVITDSCIQNVCRIPCLSPVITLSQTQNVCRIPCPGLLSQTHTKCLQNPMPRSVITDTYKMSAESHALLSQTHTKCQQSPTPCYHRHIQLQHQQIFIQC